VLHPPSRQEVLAIGVSWTLRILCAKSCRPNASSSLLLLSQRRLGQVQLFEVRVTFEVSAIELKARRWRKLISLAQP